MYVYMLDQTIFSFALALLRDSKREILSLSFEGILQFFRATMPRKYLGDSACQHLVDLATGSMRVCLFVEWNLHVLATHYNVVVFKPCTQIPYSLALVYKEYTHSTDFT